MAAPRSYEKYMEEDELKAKSEEIDLFHVDFNWTEFRNHGMRFPFGLNSSKPQQRNGHSNSNHSSKTNGKYNSNSIDNKNDNSNIKTNKMFQTLCADWTKLCHEMKLNNDNNENNDNDNDNSRVNASTNCNTLSSECGCINRLLFILTTYHKWCADIHNDNGISSGISIVEIIDNLPLYSSISLYNDYCHMLDFHSSFEEFWTFVHDKFSSCDLQKCKLFMRNHRSRENFMEVNARKSLFFGYECSDDVINIQFLDRVHTFLLHSNINITEENNLYKNVIKNNEQEIEQKLRKFQDFRIKRQKELQKCQINLANNTKFVTEIEEEKKEKKVFFTLNDIKSKVAKHHNINDAAPEIKKSLSATHNNTELNEYSFGATFKYWDHFSHKKVFCVPKYKNLRQEMLLNRVFTVSEFQWNDTLYKAIQIKMSYKGKSLFAINRGGTNNHYSIPFKMPISLSHIMVVLFYCNFDSLQRKFKQQCRPTHKKESRHSLNQRNSEIGHWFSLLKEVCWFYGQAMKPGDIFYHGINKTLLFTQFHARFRFPLSTTTSLKEASLFANFHTSNKQKTKKKKKVLNVIEDGGDSSSSSSEDEDEEQEIDKEGIIIELGYCELCFYIDVQMMSDFPAENEKLFFGADLAIQNIYYQNKSYKKFVSALTLFQSIINGRFFVDILKENKVYQQILLNMINNFQYKYGYNSKQKRIKTQPQQQHASNIIDLDAISYNYDIPEYIQDLFEYFYLNQHYVWIIKSQLKYLEPTLKKYFVPVINNEDDEKHNDNDEDDIYEEEEEYDAKKYVLNLAGDYDLKHQYIKSYPLKYCVEYIWNICGDDFSRFKTMKNGEWINCEQEFIYNINQYEYNEMDENDNYNEEDAEEEDILRDEECYAVFQCSCAPSKTGKHSFFMKVNTLSHNLERILFGVDLYCPLISFKTSVPRRWFKQSDYLGYTMFDSEKLKHLKTHFEWHIAIKIYDYKKINVANR